MITDLREIIKNIEVDKRNLGKVLRELEKNGTINSKGDITVNEAAILATDYRIESYVIDRTKNNKYLNIGLVKIGAKNSVSLVITENGNLYLSK